MQTFSDSRSACTIFANVGITESYASGKLMPSRRGHESHVAACGSHSAGIRNPSARGVPSAAGGGSGGGTMTSAGISSNSTRSSGSACALRLRVFFVGDFGFLIPNSINKSASNIGVGVDAPVAQKRPMRAVFVHARKVDLNEERFLAIDARFRNDSSRRIAHKTLAPEFDTRPAVGRFVAD